MPGKVWDKITYPFLNFNGCTIEVKEWISNFIPYIIMGVITYPCWELKLNHVSKRGHRCLNWVEQVHHHRECDNCKDRTQTILWSHELARDTIISCLYTWVFWKKKSKHLGAVSIRKTVLPGMAIPMLKIRRPNGRLIFNMEITIRR